MNAALTITIHLQSVTSWLFLAVPGFLLLGFVVAAVWAHFGAEIEALLPLYVGFVLAGISLILAIGSML